MKYVRLLLLIFFSIAFAAAPVLETAHELSDGVFRDWKYGSYSEQKRQLDCTTYISALADTLISRKGIEYTPEMCSDVLIAHNNLDRNVVKEGPDPADPRYAGVVYMLEKHQLGKRIDDMSAVRPGDFIQYWIRRGNGTWFGHASVIESVRYDPNDKHYKARILGAHKSMNGIAVSRFELLLDAPGRHVYIGRMF